MHPELRLHHLGIAVRDLGKAATSYQRTFGFRMLSGPFEDLTQGVSVCFIGSGLQGDLMYELVAPLSSGAPSPVDRILSQGRDTSYHVCYEVHGVAEMLAHFIRGGASMFWPPSPAVAFNGRCITWVLMPTAHVVELLEAEEANGTR